MTDFKKSPAKILTITFVVIVVLIAGIWYVSKDINRRITVFQNLQNQIAITKGEANALVALRSAAVKAQEITPVLDTYLIDKDDVVVNFKSVIEGLTKENKIIFPSFSFTGEGVLTNEGFTRTNFTLGFVSAYDDLINFFKATENSHFVIKIINPDVSKQDAKFNVLMSGQVFSFPFN